MMNDTTMIDSTATIGNTTMMNDTTMIDSTATIGNTTMKIPSTIIVVNKGSFDDVLKDIINIKFPDLVKRGYSLSIEKHLNNQDYEVFLSVGNYGKISFSIHKIDIAEKKVGELFGWIIDRIFENVKSFEFLERLDGIDTPTDRTR